MQPKGLKTIAISFLLLATFACSSSKPGVDPVSFRSSVNVRQNPNPYYHQQPVYNQSPGYMPYVQNSSPPAQYYYQRPPSYQPAYVPYGGPAASRFYSNPYAIPPSQQYQRYDADQYYVPPTRYNGVEPRNSGSSASVGWTSDSGDKP